MNRIESSVLSPISQRQGDAHWCAFPDDALALGTSSAFLRPIHYLPSCQVGRFSNAPEMSVRNDGARTRRKDYDPLAEDEAGLCHAIGAVQVNRAEPRSRKESAGRLGKAPDLVGLNETLVIL